MNPIWIKAAELYKSGKTQSEVANILGISRDVVRYAIKKYDIPTNKYPPRKGEQIYNFNKGKIFIKDGYYAIRRNYKPILLHRIIAKANDDEVVHHINGNRQDNRPENLIKMSNSEHITLHHKQGDLKSL